MPIPIRHRQVCIAVLALLPLLATAAQPAPAAAPAPKPASPSRTAKAESVARDLLVELREHAVAQDGAEEADAPTGYSVSTLPADGGVAPQQVRVQSGEKAMLRMVQSTPMQWVQSGQHNTTTVAAGAASAMHSGGSITQATTVVEAGQTLVVTPHWAGASRPVRVELQWQADTVAERTGAELPATTRRQVSTTLRVPLHQWVTIATRGANSSAGTYSSAGAMEPRRALQLRVSLP